MGWGAKFGWEHPASRRGRGCFVGAAWGLSLGMVKPWFGWMHLGSLEECCKIDLFEGSSIKGCRGAASGN